MKAKLAEKVLLGKEEISEFQVMDFGFLRLSETEIIEFAKIHDPLWLHTDPETAKKGPWGGIIASGPMLFVEFHKRFWIPRFGATVIAGLGIHHWNYFKPHWPDQNVKGLLKVDQITLREDQNSAAIRWAYEFQDEKGIVLQTAEFTVLHSIGGFTWI